MAEYIEREALIEKLRTMPIPKQAGRANTWLDNCAAGVNAAIREVASCPAADVAPVVHGRWVTHYRSGTPVAEGYVSTCCDMWNNRKSDYCPSCGAKMDGGCENA